MDNQGNSFNNMIQSSGVPEVKNSEVNPQVNMFSNVNQNSMINSNNNGVMGEQGSSVNVDDTTVLNFNIPSTSNDVLGVDNNSVPVGNIIPPVVENNNEVKSDLIENTTTLNFAMPAVNSVNNSIDGNSNINNNLNSVGGVSSVDVEQPSLQPVSDTVNSNDQSSGSNILQNVEVVNDTTENNVANNEVSFHSENNESNSEKSVEVASVKDYLIHMILCMIPVVGIIILIVRAINQKNKNITNLARAQLIMSAIAVIFSVVLFVVFGSMIFSILG